MMEDEGGSRRFICGMCVSVEHASVIEIKVRHFWMDVVQQSLELYVVPT